MGYIYHIVPDDMRGNILYPLNQLKTVYPDIYTNEVKKYNGRLELLNIAIPPLRCLWNDVLHLTAIHPEVLKRALQEAGRTEFHQNFFEIDSSVINPASATIFIPGISGSVENGYYETYSPEALEKYREIPDSTLEYYKHEISNGKKPLLYHGVPHIFLKDALSVKDVRIIRL